MPKPAEFVAVVLPDPVLRADAEVPAGPVFVAVEAPGPSIVAVELVYADVLEVNVYAPVVVLPAPLGVSFAGLELSLD